MAVKNTRNMDFIIGGNIIGTDHQTKTRISVVNGKKTAKEKKGSYAVIFSVIK